MGVVERLVPDELWGLFQDASGQSQGLLSTVPQTA